MRYVFDSWMSVLRGSWPIILDSIIDCKMTGRRQIGQLTACRRHKLCYSLPPDTPTAKSWIGRYLAIQLAQRPVFPYPKSTCHRIFSKNLRKFSGWVHIHIQYILKISISQQVLCSQYRIPLLYRYFLYYSSFPS